MKRFRIISTLIIPTILLLSCATAPSPVKNTAPATAQEYSDYYGLDFPKITHEFDFIKAAGFNIAVHTFLPDSPEGTAILIHGYYDHSALERNLIQRLTVENLAVVAFDLPGHGLSSGPRASIDSFSQYSDVLETITGITLEDYPQPQHIIGHSTGASVIIDSALHGGLDEFSGLVLVSPLVHINYWTPAILGSSIAEIFTDELPRGFRDNSSDQSYLNFVHNDDPLQYRGIPLKWYDALIEWNNEISDLDKSEHQLLILQGKDDSIVDYDYNLNFIRGKFPNTSTVFIEGAKHQLYNEIPTLRSQVFEEIIKYLM